MNIWTVAREYSGIAEAGGVKDVSCALSESLVRIGETVTLFIPLYGCTDLSSINDFTCVWHRPVEISVCQKRMIVTFSCGTKNGVNIVFIGNKAFSEKNAVYTYTCDDEQKNPNHKKGLGHEDAQFLNTLFQKAVVAYGRTCSAEEAPDIIFCHDATAAMVPVFVHFAKERDRELFHFYRNTSCIVTIHNAGSGYHHIYKNVDEAVYYTNLPEEFLAGGLNGMRVEPFVLAAHFAKLTTVSPQYASEIMDSTIDTGELSELFRRDKRSVIGITNGIDFEFYDPANSRTSCLPFAYNPANGDFTGKYKCRDFLISNWASDSSKIDTGYCIARYGFLKETVDNPVYIAYHGRVVRQKGISVLVQSAEKILQSNIGAKFIFIGQGEKELEESLIQLAERHGGDCVYFQGYDKSLSRLCIAAADIAVFPSNFEPCGTADFVAQILGTLCLAHATGGLKKIVDGETGFLYEPNTPEVLYDYLYSLIRLINRAGRDIFRPMLSYTAAYIKNNYSWDIITREKYLPLFKELMQNK